MCYSAYGSCRFPDPAQWTKADPMVVDTQLHQNWRNSVEILRGKGWRNGIADRLFFAALRMWVAAANGSTRPMIQCGTDFRRTCGRKAGIVICREPSQANKSYDSLEMKNSIEFTCIWFQHVPACSTPSCASQVPYLRQFWDGPDVGSSTLPSRPSKLRKSNPFQQRWSTITSCVDLFELERSWNRNLIWKSLSYWKYLEIRI